MKSDLFRFKNAFISTFTGSDIGSMQTYILEIKDNEKRDLRPAAHGCC